MKLLLIILVCFLYCVEVFMAPPPQPPPSPSSSNPTGRRTEAKICTYRPFVRCTDPLKKQNIDTEEVIVEKRATGETKICSLGPTYWCENMEQAKECDKVNYCTEKGWKI